MIRRPRRSIPATIVAAVVLAICVLTVLSVIQSLLGQTPLITLPTLLGATSAQTWDGAATITAAIVIAVIGLILLLVAIRPGRPTVLALSGAVGADGRAGAVAGVRRASLAKDLSAAAGAVPGVSSAKVSAGRRTLTAQVTVAAADPSAVPDQVRERLETRLDEIGPSPRPRVRVRTSRDKNT